MKTKTNISGGASHFPLALALLSTLKAHPREASLRSLHIKSIHKSLQAVRLAALICGLAVAHGYAADSPSSPSAPVTVMNTSKPVTVMNTSNNPVPVIPLGTTTIGGSVNIANAVQIGNTTNAPVPVRVVSDPARNEVLQRDVVLRLDAHGGFTNFYTVPAGKRLVIEYVSGEAFAVGGAFDNVKIRTQAAGEATFHYMVLNSGPPNPSRPDVPFYHFGGLARIYADAGTPVGLGVSSVFELGSGVCELSISGYLVDIP